MYKKKHRTGRHPGQCIFVSFFSILCRLYVLIFRDHDDLSIDRVAFRTRRSFVLIRTGRMYGS